MDLKKVEEYNEGVQSKLEEIKKIENRIYIAENLSSIRVWSQPTNLYPSSDFLMSIENDEHGKNIDVFKVLLIKKLEEQLIEKEKELENYIKKGITEND